MRRLQKNEPWAASLYRAFSEFLLLPTMVILCFIGLAWFTNQLDQMRLPWLRPARAFLQQHFFSDPKATSDLLSAIVSGTISVTTLTTTLLLVIVQQSAGAMTAQVFDQFLRRRTNQFYLGFFVGLALFAMVTLATVNAPFNPVLGGTVAFSLTAVALYLLVILMYTTIDQMRPSQIVHAIYLRILAARQRQQALLAYTTNRPLDRTDAIPVKSRQAGYLTDIDAKRLYALIGRHCPGSRVAFLKPVGQYVCFGETFAEMVPARPAQEDLLRSTLFRCCAIGIQRDIDADPAYGIQQLETIAWTSTSTAKSNPAPGLLCANVMHNLLNSFLDEAPCPKEGSETRIHYQDNTFEQLLQGFENLGVVSSESMQHQIFIAVLRALQDGLQNADAAQGARLEGLILILISVLGDHVLTTALRNALGALTETLHQQGRTKTAQALEEAVSHLERSVGVLNSRSTRV